MKTLFEKNDIVRIKTEIYNNYANNVCGSVNAFVITDIDEDSVRLSNIKTSLALYEIEPLPIDTISDSCVYYDPVIFADIIVPGTCEPFHSKDFSYFVDGFSKTTIGSRTLKELFLEQNFQNVHEVQHWLREEFDHDGLKVMH